MTPVPQDPSSWKRVLAHGVAAVLWLVIFRLLAKYGVYLLPTAVANQLTLQSYLAGVAVISTAVGLVLCVLLIQEPLPALGLSMPSARALGLSVSLAIPVFVIVSAVAIAIALPTLLDELRRGGRQLAQQSTGEFGRSLVRSPAWLTLLWGALISPVAEELLFRGALWSFINRLIPTRKPDTPPASTALPEGVVETGVVLKAARALSNHLRTGGIATLVTAGIFAALHADMSGGLGIVRTVSTLGLALCAGLFRHMSGGIWAPLLLHIIFNTASIATARRWVVTASLPIKFGIPTLLLIVGGVSLVVAIVFAIASRSRTRAAASE